jgi:polar amino acid transport system substrate-binding protein
MRKFAILLFFCVFAFSQVNVYVPKDFNGTFPKSSRVVKYEKFKKEYLKNGLVVLKSEKLPFIIDNNLTIITPIGEQKNYILSHVPLNKIETLANANLAAKIFFSVFKNGVVYQNASFKQFLNGKVDAYLTHTLYFKPGLYHYDLKRFGVVFNKYYLVSTKKFMDEHPDDVEFINDYLQEKDKVNKFVNVNSIMSYALYKRKKVDFSKILRFNYFDNKFSNRKVYTVYVTGNWPPFVMKKNGKFTGIGIDVWKTVAKKAGIKYKFVQDNVWNDILEKIKEKKADITPVTSMTTKRVKFAIFSKPYMSFPFAIACKKNEKLKTIYDIKSMAVGFNFTAYAMMKERYPVLNYLPTKNVYAAFNLVENSKAQCVVDVLPTVQYLLKKKKYSNMKIFFETPFKFKFQIMLRKDLKFLRSKINTAIDSLNSLQKRRIINKYLKTPQATNETNSKQYFVFVGIIFGLVLAMSFIVLKNFKYKTLSQTDALTGALNRGAIEKILKKTLKKGGSVAFFDIDFFKKVNDTYGHEKGDFVLREIVKLVKSKIREDDYFGRWGGEEFLLILPETSFQNAMKVAEKLRKYIENHNFDGINITASFGVTEMRKDDDVMSLIQRADEMLYNAKNNGRNQVKGTR